MKISIFGDFCPRDMSLQNIQKLPSLLDQGGLLDQIKSADLSILNLECPLTVTENKFNKTGPNIKSFPETARVIREMGFTSVALANNHIFDFGSEGLKDTLNHCEEVGLDAFGAGLSHDNAQVTFSKSIRGDSLAIINAAENESCAATKHHGGANPLNVITLSRNIAKAKKNNTYVLVIIHGGNEFSNYPSPNVVERYRFFIDQGADAVVAHHPHVVQGFEIYHNRPILYSLGNFIFPSKKYNSTADGWSLGMGASIDFPFTGEDCLNLTPFYQSTNKSTISLLSSEGEEEFRKYLSKLSKSLNNIDSLEKLWLQSLDSQATTLLWYLSYGSLPMQVIRKFLAKLRLLGVLTHRRSRTNKLRLAVIKTEAHRDLIISTLEKKFKN